MLYQVSLDTLVPADNFYRKLDRTLNLHFLYKATSKYYGTEGQKSIDPVVFFKILLVGYLNNNNRDRKQLEFCNDSSAVRSFLNLEIDEALPSHSNFYSKKQRSKTSKLKRLLMRSFFSDLQRIFSLKVKLCNGYPC
jgi:transposase